MGHECDRRSSARLLPVALGILAAAWVQAAVEVQPSDLVLVGGEDAAFSARSPSGFQGWVWTLEEEGKDPVPLLTNTCTAPQVTRVRRLQVRATDPREPGECGEARLTILPRALFERAAPDQQIGEAPAGMLPFLIPGTRRRYGAETRILSLSPRDLATCPSVVAGYGLPRSLACEAPAGTEAELLSYWEGDDLRCSRVEGGRTGTFSFRGPVRTCSLETLGLTRGRDGKALWESCERRLCVRVRGLLPFAGCPGAEPACRDGLGCQVRFRAPHGLAELGGGLFTPARIVLADPESHMVRSLSPEGEGEGGWGRDGEPGSQDGDPGEARFHRPTFLAVEGSREPYQGSYAFVLSDSGNHLIRKVDARGRVSTLAGVAGCAGYRDADDARQALFNNPLGLVVDPEGDVFVADAGNQVIRRIARSGCVSTLAGEAGSRGGQDGTGSQARFSGLAGLGFCGQDGCLYALDGHALRRVTRGGEVTTVLGVPDRPGFLDTGEETLAGVPCLHSPSSLCGQFDTLYIADLGNHAVRQWNPATGVLRTLVGDPGLAGPRFGLLRDGVDGPLDESDAALHQPRGVVACAWGGDLLVTTDACVVRLARQDPPGWNPPRPELNLDKRILAVGEPLRVDFTGSTRSPWDSTSRPFTFVLEFINGDGQVAESQRGSGHGDQTMSRVGAFSGPGTGAVRLRCVTDQGHSLGSRKAVEVR